MILNPKGVEQTEFLSDAKTEEAISQDFIPVLAKLKQLLISDKKFTFQDVLLYLDGTNFHITCMGFDQKTKKLHYPSTCGLNLLPLGNQLYKDGFGSDAFEFMVEEALTLLEDHEALISLKKRYNVYLQNDLGEIERL